MSTATAVADVEVVNEGSIVLLKPQTPEGSQWLQEHCQHESWQWFGHALAVEPRYAEAVIDGMIADGLGVE